MKKLGFCFFIMSIVVQAEVFKVGVLAPDGTNWAKSLKALNKEIEAQTKGEVSFKYYFGGSQGDESDVLRKIRIGQLQGGIFTGKTLGDINGDVRIMEVPFNFMNDREKGNRTLNKLSPFLSQGLSSLGFINLGFFEIGFVYFISKNKVSDLNSLKGIKIWSWDGDPLVAAMIENMNLVSVPLSLPDVLSSLSTGVIEAAYAPAVGIVALQWNTKIKYLLDFPISYSVGAFLLDSKSLNKISTSNIALLKKLSIKHIQNINTANIADNQESLKSMKSSGVEFISFSKKDIEQGVKVRSQVLNMLKGKVISAKAIELLQAELK
jgi:TRAP-type C4-dicarboxylate transport system substrate-binding protein